MGAAKSGESSKRRRSPLLAAPTTAFGDAELERGVKRAEARVFQRLKRLVPLLPELPGCWSFCVEKG